MVAISRVWWIVWIIFREWESRFAPLLNQMRAEDANETILQAIYIAGTPHFNMPWGADGYSPLDLTLLDRHFGDIEEWRKAIAEIHARDMYVVFDCTIATYVYFPFLFPSFC
jgi:hypothetical protein